MYPLSLAEFKTPIKVLELAKELLKVAPNQTIVTPLTLAITTVQPHARIRRRGLLAHEILPSEGPSSQM